MEWSLLCGVESSIGRSRLTDGSDKMSAVESTPGWSRHPTEVYGNVESEIGWSRLPDGVD